MKMRSPSLTLFAALSLTAGMMFAGSAIAQDDQVADQVAEPHARFMVMPPHLRTDVAPPPASLQSWNGSFTFGSTTYNYNMVGAAPSTNTTATVTTYIIPVKIVITPRRGSQIVYDPSHVLSNGTR